MAGLDPAIHVFVAL